MEVSGEIGWHTHGTGDNIDVDMDLAVILSAEETIDPSVTNIVLVGQKLVNKGFSSADQFEVMMLKYKRGLLSDPEDWWLVQGLCEKYQGGDVLYNLNGYDWNDITSPVAGSYVKYGAVTNTAYWSENVQARVIEDNRVVLALARPSLSNTIVFKAGS